MIVTGCDEDLSRCIGDSVSNGGVCVCPEGTAWIPSSGHCESSVGGASGTGNQESHDPATSDAGDLLDATSHGSSEDASDATTVATADSDAGSALDGSRDAGLSDYDADVSRPPDAALAAVQEVWVDWTECSIEQGSAQGTFALQGVVGGLTLTYAGKVNDAQVNGGLPYWTPGTPFTSAAVPNPPDSSDMIMLPSGVKNVHTLTFSAPVTNPVLAVFSLGNEDGTAVLTFDDDFEVLSGGGAAYYGQQRPLERLPDQTLSGREASGVIRFNGTYTRLRWTTVADDPWYGVTVGVPAPP